MSYSKSWVNAMFNIDYIYKVKVANVYQIPKIRKITLFIDFSSDVNNVNNIISGLMILKMITGQKPIICRSKSSISGTNLRKGTIVGCKSVIKKNNLYDFLDILVFYLFPQEQKLKSLNLDSRGNFVVQLNKSSTFFKFFNKNFKFSSDLKIVLTINISFVDINSLRLFLDNLQISAK